MCVLEALLVSCTDSRGQSSGAVENSERDNSYEWQYRWLKGIPCRAPCWENIVPEQTTAEQALTGMRNNPLVSNPDNTLHRATPDLGFLDWDWTGNPRASNATEGTGGILLYHKDLPISTVVLISPLFPHPFTFSEVIQAYGEPSHIAILQVKQQGKIYYNTYIIYLYNGFVLNAHTSFEPDISIDMALEGLTFFEPSTNGLSSYIGSLPDQMVEWSGFKNFRYYCQPDNNGECGVN
jgi:hypothetical protein